MNKYYKVVTVSRIKNTDSFSYISAINDLYEYVLEYKLNEWTEPKIGKIFVFDTYKSAEHFMSDFPDYKIFECECVNPTIPNFERIPNLSLNHIGIILKFWNIKDYLYFKEANYAWVWEVTQGTIICDAVKLIKEVNE